MSIGKVPAAGGAAGSGRLLGKLALDLVMTLFIILEFAYDFTGGIVHELIGLSLLVLFIVHVVVNRNWFAALFKGRYGLRRAANTGVNLIVLLMVLVLLGSGLLNASLIEMLLRFKWSFSTRGVHSVAGYWFLLLMAIHLGMHWTVILNECRRRLGKRGPAHGVETVILRVVAGLALIGGALSAVHQDLLSRLLATYSFSYWDEGAVLRYFADYAAMVAGVAVLAHYFRGRLPAGKR